MGLFLTFAARTRRQCLDSPEARKTSTAVQARNQTKHSLAAVIKKLERMHMTDSDQTKNKLEIMRIKAPPRTS